MSNTIQKYKDYVMTGFLKSVAPIVIDRANGAVVTDINGREYLDCFAGISVVNAGHCNPQVIAAAKAQMDKLVHCSSYLYHVQPVADLAEKIAHIAPGNLTKTFFGNGGAEAIEGAMKLARLYTGKHEFIALHASFHGRSWGALSITGNMGRKKRGGPYAPGVAFAPAPYVYRSQWPNDPDECGRQCAKAIDEVMRLRNFGRRGCIHRRASHGRRRHPGSSRELFQRSEEGPRPVRNPLHRRRSPIRLRPHRQDVCHANTTVSIPTSWSPPRALPTASRSALSRPALRSLPPTSPEIISRPSEAIQFPAPPPSPTSSSWRKKTCPLALPNLATTPWASFANCKSRIRDWRCPRTWPDDRRRTRERRKN